MLYKTKSLLADKAFLKTAVFLALPIILQSLLISCLTMADIVMVGYISDKDIEIAAVNISNQVYFITSMLFIAVGAGCSVFISRYIGSRELHNAKKVITLGIFAITFLSGIITLVSIFAPTFILSFFTNDSEILLLAQKYLKIVALSYILTSVSYILICAIRCSGNSKLPLAASFAGISVNVILNYILIFGKLGFPALGVEGAAIATVIARIIEFILVLIFAFNKNSIWRGEISEYFSFSRKFVLNIYKGLLPVLVNDFQWGLANVMYCVAYGRIGINALTVTPILKSVSDLLLVVCIGFSNTALIMISQKIGEGDIKSARTYGVYFDILAVFSGVVISVFLFFFAETAAGLFGLSGANLLSAVKVLRFLAVMFPIRSLAVMLIIGVLRGNGDIPFAMWTEICSMWLVGVPLAFLGVFLGLSVEYVVLLTFAEEAVKSVISIIRQKSKKSIKHMPGSKVANC